MSTLDHIHRTLETMQTNLVEIQSTLAAQHVSLTEHMRRTECAEQRLSSLEKMIVPMATMRAAQTLIVRVTLTLLAAVGSVMAIWKTLNR